MSVFLTAGRWTCVSENHLKIQILFDTKHTYLQGSVCIASGNPLRAWPAQAKDKNPGMPYRLIIFIQLSLQDYLSVHFSSNHFYQWTFFEDHTKA